ncbi:hypothetical protein A2307_01245 [Candidatus Peregrinibacteria bacterium RIFOXYB2_FULL_33_20]|nr:MAG: hypothetical protein A2307_01245 [Candidatus Peregrinibacteria bacterium RIFOXYB2_FULL_33_20]
MHKKLLLYPVQNPPPSFLREGWGELFFAKIIYIKTPLYKLNLIKKFKIIINFNYFLLTKNQ